MSNKLLSYLALVVFTVLACLILPLIPGVIIGIGVWIVTDVIGLWENTYDDSHR